MPDVKFKLSILLFAGLALVGFFAPSISHAQNANWMMFRHNAAHTGQSPLSGPIFPDLAWQFDTAGLTYSSPAVTDNRVYVASKDQLIALDLDAQELWRHTFPGSSETPAIDIEGLISSPAIAANGTVYIGSLDHNLYAVDPIGNQVWAFNTGGEVFSSPAIGPTGLVYVGSRSRDIYALNPNGSLQWSASTSGEVFSSPALGANGTVYVGDTDGRLYAFNGVTGAAQWPAFVAGEAILSSPAVGTDGSVYFGANDDQVYAVNGATGQAKWAVPYQAGDILISSPAIGSNGTIYIGSFDGNVHAIDSATGAAKWSTPFSTSASITASPAIDSNGYIYITSLDGNLYVLQDNGTQAELLWSFPTGGPIWASPAIGGQNRVYFASSGSLDQPGRFFAIGESAYRVTFTGEPTAGQDASVSILLTSNSSPASGTLHYRRAGDVAFTPVPFTGTATIPAADVTGRGLEYYVDGPGGLFPAETPQNNPATQTVFVPQETAPLPFQLRRYRMISVPYNLSQTSIDAVLGDDFEAYNPLRWRLHHWTGSGFVEYPSISEAFTPGTAFFLVTANGSSFDIESGRSVDTADPYPILLKPGWNQIGNPFAFPVPWSRINRDFAAPSALAFFNGVEMIQDPEALATMDPWEGYFLFNGATENVLIEIPPVASIETETDVTAEKIPAQSARLQIVARLPELDLSDTQNWVGFDETAEVGLDGLDTREAPPFGDHVRLSIRENGVAYALNYKPWSDAGQSWTLELTSSLPQEALAGKKIEFSFLRSAAFSEDIKLALIDEDLGYARTLEAGTTSIEWDAEFNTRRFRLVAGSESHLTETLENIPLAPEKASLEPNFPNPFQQTTAIRYHLDRRENVRLVVYNVAGQTVQTLVNESQTPGSYEVMWNGRDEAGRPVGSGIYFYRLQAGRFSDSGKMALLR